MGVIVNIVYSLLKVTYFNFKDRWCYQIKRIIENLFFEMKMLYFNFKLFYLRNKSKIYFFKWKIEWKWKEIKWFLEDIRKGVN